MKGNVYLVGMPGSGKSEVARLVAASLEVPFVDLDEEVEAEAGMSIAAIFGAEGESGFRRRETAALSRVSSRNRMIVACGGGIILGEDNRTLLGAGGTVVWLDVSTEVIAERVDFGTDRPLLRTPADVGALLKEREAAYRDVADAVVPGDDEPEVVAAEVLRALEGAT